MKSTKVVFPAVDDAEHVVNVDGGVAEDDGTFFLTVDGMDCPIQEPTPFSKTWFSHKFKGPAIKHEIAIDLNGNFAWVSPPHRGSANDKAIFDRELRQLIPAGCLVICDKGCDADDVLAPHDEVDDDEAKCFKARALARHETGNKRVKDFAITSTHFRDGVEFHCAAFDAVVVLCQCDIQRGEPLFEL